jgi:hypothetical protein
MAIANAPNVPMENVPNGLTGNVLILMAIANAPNVPMENAPNGLILMHPPNKRER